MHIFTKVTVRSEKYTERMARAAKKSNRTLLTTVERPTNPRFQAKFRVRDGHRGGAFRVISKTT